MSQQVTYCGVWQSPTSARTFDEMMTKRTIFGAGGPAAITFQHPTILKNVLGANVQVIPGYPGSRDLNLAMHRGEVDGVCGLDASSIRSQWPDDVRSGQLKLVIQMGNKKSDEFGDIPSVFDYAKTDEQRAVFEVLFKQLLLGRPLAGPPGIPADRLRALREALDGDHEGQRVPGRRRQGGSRDRSGFGTGGRRSAQALRRLSAGGFPQGAGSDRALTRRRPVDWLPRTRGLVACRKRWRARCLPEFG